MLKYRMKVPEGLKKKSKSLGLNFPLDKRTKAYKLQVDNFRSEKQYLEYIRSTIKRIEQKEKKKVQQYTKEIELLKYKEERLQQDKLKYEKTERFIGNILVEYQITEDRDLEGGGSEIVKMKKVFLNKDRSIYVITSTLRFDRTIKKSFLDKEIIDTIEKRRIEILNSDGYIIDVKVVNYKSDIHKYNEGIKTENIRMRNAGSYMINGYDNQEWDTKTGRCVFDYIIHLYGKTKGFIKDCKYEKLNEIFRFSDEENCLETGVNTTQILKFCVIHNISMFAFDDTEKTFMIHQPTKRYGHAPVMAFRVSNNHFYPIPNERRISMLKSATNSISEMMIHNKKQEDTISKNENTIILESNDAMIELGKFLNEYQVIPTNIKMTDKSLKSFKSEKNKYIVNQNVLQVEEIVKNMGLEYSSQSISYILNIIIEQSIGTFPKSSHNPIVFDCLNIAKKSRVFSGLMEEYYKDLLKSNKSRARDITKCYTSILYNPIEEWITFDFNDEWVKYKKGDKIELGLYYVETTDNTLFKKNDIYSSSIIKKAIVEDIPFTIKYKLISKKYQEKTLFKSVIDNIVKYCNGKEQLYKLLINALSGLLGRSKSSNSMCFINNDIEQIFGAFSVFEENHKKAFINRIPETDYYLYGIDNETIMNETNLPMYIQVLDQSNIKVYDLMKKMTKKGGYMIGRKVDCVVIHYPFGEIVELKDNKNWGDDRGCNIPEINYAEKYIEKDYIFNRKWEDYNINDSDRWEEIMNIIIEKGGLLLQSDAGNGKTFVAKKICEKLGKCIKRIAPTNKAALNIGGSTIHRFLKLNEEGIVCKSVLDNISKNYKYIVVDEISMITKELWRRLVLVKQATGVVFLLLGDKKQLPPVENEDIDDYFDSSAVKYLVNNNRNILNVRKRFDEKLYNMLKNVDELDVKMFDNKMNKRNLCYLNKTRKYVNKLWNKKVNDCLFIEEDINDEYTQDMYIYKGLPVIARETYKKGDICVNNETFEVINFDDEYIYLYTERSNDGEIESHSIDIKISDFRKLFSLNYCSTVHKSQGETIVEDFTIWDFPIMSTKCKYTALSRAKNPEQISFNNYEVEKREDTFVKNIERKIKSHIKYDVEKGYNTDISVEFIQDLFVKQNGECKICECNLKTFNYLSNDNKQFSIDRIDSSKGHIKENIQLLCWGCNRSKMNRR